MDAMVRQGLEAELRGDEGVKLKVYDDATGKPIGPGSVVVGNPSIGVGRNLSGRGLKGGEVQMLLDNDVEDCEAELLAALPWLTKLSANRQIVIYSLYFNVGLGNASRFLAKWPHFLEQMQTGSFAAAADNLETTEPWASQVGPRAHRLGELVRYG